MTLKTPLDQDSDLTTADYLVAGIATCFLRNEGELETVKVLEPVPSAYLESLLQGIPTSYEIIFATTVGDLSDDGEIARLTRHYNASVGENFGDRVAAAARTYKMRPSATELIPADNPYTDLNYSTEKKRVLNLKKVVKKEDNVRQHKYTHQKL